MMIVPDTVTAYDRFLNIIMCMLLFGIPIILLTNAGNTRDKLPVFNKRSLKFNILGGFLATVIIITGMAITNGLKSPEQIRLESTATQQRTIKKTVSDLDSKIEKLGDVNELSLEKASDVKAIRSSYEALTSEEKELVTRFAGLEAAEKRIADLESAADLDNKITVLGDVSALTIEKEVHVKALRTAYETLTPEQKTLVTKLDILESAESKIADIQAQRKAAADVDSKITALGDVNNLTLSNATSVSDARKAYESLTSEGQAVVTKIAVLESAEKKITDLQTAEKLAAEKAAAEKAASASSSSSGSASTTVTSPTPARSPSNSYTVYITKTGEKYHRAGCRYLSRSQISISKADAISSGYTPCSVCNP